LRHSGEVGKKQKIGKLMAKIERYGQENYKWPMQPFLSCKVVLIFIFRKTDFSNYNACQGKRYEDGKPMEINERE